MKLTSIALAALLSGCAMFPADRQDSTTWIKVAEPLPYVWQVVPESELMARCSFKFIKGEAACAIRIKDGPNGPYCLILSSITEQQAARTFVYSPTGAVRSLDGKAETLADHEIKHCAGFNHEESK